MTSVIQQSNDEADEIETMPLPKPVAIAEPERYRMGLGHLTSNNEENEPTDLEPFDNEEMYADDERLEDDEEDDLTSGLF